MTNKGDSFDRLSRALAGAKSRREAMRLLGGGLIAALGGALMSKSARADHIPLVPPGTFPPCAHSKCETGEPLPYYCEDDDPCRQRICLWDDYCCNPVWGEWDETCVGYVKSVCGEDCPKPDRKSAGSGAPGRRDAPRKATQRSALRTGRKEVR